MMLSATIEKVGMTIWTRPSMTSTRNLFAKAKGWAMSRPLQAASTILAVKGVFCDGIAQKVVEKKEEWDPKRTFILSLYGGAAEAPLAYYFYSVLFPRWFPGQSVRNLVGMLLVDNLVVWPGLIYPSFYLINGKVLEHRMVSEIAKRYYEEFWEVNSVSMAVWLPVNTINFWIMPTQLRASFMACVAFCYTTWWSVQQAQLQQHRAPAIMAPNYGSNRYDYCWEVCAKDFASEISRSKDITVAETQDLCRNLCRATKGCCNLAV